jgi:5-methylcytosine-specific restriction enzyme A
MNSTNRSRLPPLEMCERVIADAVSIGTGAAIITQLKKETRSTLRVGFSDLGWNHSPFIDIKPHGLKRFKFNSGFGTYARSTIERMNKSDDESHVLAYSLMDSISCSSTDVKIPQMQNNRLDLNPAFGVSGLIKDLPASDAETKMKQLAVGVIAPIMSAFAELNGYDMLKNDVEDRFYMEGQVKVVEIRRRERNPRNRLLALRIHGTTCRVCEIDHAVKFGLEHPIIDIHHVQPLSEAGSGRLYDPRIDLIPLCPSCHRAAHIRKPVPFSIAELRSMQSKSV